MVTAENKKDQQVEAVSFKMQITTFVA
jgi:hypothetical protein